MFSSQNQKRRMGHPAGRKGSLRWSFGTFERGHLALLSVVVVVTAPSSCVNATVDNHPADGYLHSGYFWPKTLYWHGIRHPPGIYWFVYFFFLEAALLSIIGSVVNSQSDASPDPDDSGVDLFEGITEFLFAMVSATLGSGLLFISVAATNLSDVVQGYLIGMCIVQVLVDTLRSTIRCKPENFYVVFFTVVSFQASAAFGIALLDSYRPLNQLNAAYSVLGVIVTVLTTLASVAEKRRLKVVGFVAGLLQMVFCIAAFVIANQVADVNKSQTMAFLITALVNNLIVTFIELMKYCCRK